MCPYITLLCDSTSSLGGLSAIYTYFVCDNFCSNSDSMVIICILANLMTCHKPAVFHKESDLLI